MAIKAETVGVKKALMGWRNTLALAVLAGAFIALGAVFSTTVTVGAAGQLTFGVTRLLAGLAFCLGLILVVVAGAELFTGNNLIVMAWADHRLTLGKVLRNWGLVYTGNFIGALATAVVMLLTLQYTFSNGAVGLTALNIAAAKCSLGFVQAIALGMMCNALVCLAVWLCYSARTTTDKILAIIFPITAFVAASFEHSVANMYFIPIGLLIKATAAPEFWAAIGKTAADYSQLTWANFFIANLLPVTIGNIIGGAVMVGLVYWFVYIRKGLTTPAR
ncbi:MAG: formate transporter FocA [Anaerolinea sp.]|nr:formate transporter FocA [Anaerolinea sp.]